MDQRLVPMSDDHQQQQPNQRNNDATAVPVENMNMSGGGGVATGYIDHHTHQASAVCCDVNLWRPTQWIITVAIIVISFAIEEFATPWCRPFLWTDGAISNKYKENTFPDYSLVVIVFLTALVLGVFVYHKPQYGPAANGYIRWAEVISLLLFYITAAAFSTLMTSPLKVFDGRLRPDFLDRLKSLGYGPANDTTTDYCALSKTETLIHHGRLSFPSGHASTTFWSMTSLTLYLLTRLRVFTSPCLIRTLVAVSPMFLCFIVASTRTRDNRHHHSDILAGAIMGFLAALFSFNLHFTSVASARMQWTMLRRDNVITNNNKPWYLQDKNRDTVGDHVMRWFVDNTH